MALLQIDAGDAAIIDLAEELAEVGATLVPHPCFWDKGRFIACLDDAIGEVDILAKTHFGKASQLLIDLTTDSHVIRTGEELVELLTLTTTNAACGKEGSHRVGDSLLNRSERWVRGIRSAKGILISHSTFHIPQIVFRQNDVRVKHDEPFPISALCTIIAALSWAAIFFEVIMQIKDVCVLVANILAGFLRSVFNDDNLKVLYILMTEAFQ